MKKKKSKTFLFKKKMKKKILSHLLVVDLLGDQPRYQVQPPRVRAHDDVDRRSSGAIDGPTLEPGGADGDAVAEPIERVLERLDGDGELSAADGAEAAAEEREPDGDVVSRDAGGEGREVLCVGERRLGRRREASA